MIPALLGALSAVSGLDRYRVTSHGDNPWTLEAFMNASRLQGHYQRAARLIDGTITSVYRSERVNRAAKGVPTSRHLRALAVDIKPRLLSPPEAVAKLLHAAERGELGPVRKVLEEPTIAHIEYLAPGEQGSHGAVTSGYWEPPKDRVAT